MSELNLDAERAAELWNAQADQHNQWSELDADEKAAWIAKCAAPVGEVELPALPELTVPRIDAYTAEQVRQAQRDAIAPYAERIRVLEREVMARANPPESTGKTSETRMDAVFGGAREIQRPAQSIGDDPEFRTLLDEFRAAFIFEAKESEYCEETSNRCVKSHAALIAYIDGRTAGAADAFPGQYWSLHQGDLMHLMSLKIGAAYVDPVAAAKRCGIQIYASPSPQHGKEGGND